MAFNVRSGGLATGNVPVDGTVKSGDIVVVGELAGIAEIDATEGPDGNYYTTLALEGIANVADDDAGDYDVGDVYESNGKAVGIVTASGNGRVWFKLVPNVGA